MSRQTSRTVLSVVNSLIVLSLIVLLAAAAASYACDIDIAIKISPHVLNLSRPGDCLTVHTDISCSQVVGSSVTLNGVVIQSWKADNRGQFVAKFDMADIANLPLEVGAYNRFELTGDTIDGQIFCGAEEIMVINNAPRAK
jgi:hypothetical protein